MKRLLRLAQALGLSLALTGAALTEAALTGVALADEPLKIATSAGPVGQLAAFAAKLAKDKGQDVKIVELSDWVALNEVVNSRRQFEEQLLAMTRALAATVDQQLGSSVDDFGLGREQLALEAGDDELPVRLRLAGIDRRIGAVEGVEQFVAELADDLVAVAHLLEHLPVAMLARRTN